MLTYPRRLGPAVERVIGGDPLVEVGRDGPIAVLRFEGAGRDVAVLHQRPPDVEPLLALVDRLAWLDARWHSPRLIATARSIEGDESAVIALPAAAVTVASGLHPFAPEAVAIRLGETLRQVHAQEGVEVPFDASLASLRDRAAARVTPGSLAEAPDGPYAGRAPVELLAILDDLITDIGPDVDDDVLVHGRPTVDQLWLDPSGGLVLTGWGDAGAGDRHHDLAVAAASVGELYGPATVAPLLDAYGLDVIDVRRVDAHQLLAHLLR